MPPWEKARSFLPAEVVNYRDQSHAAHKLLFNAFITAMPDYGNARIAPIELPDLEERKLG